MSFFLFYVIVNNKYLKEQEVKCKLMYINHRENLCCPILWSLCCHNILVLCLEIYLIDKYIFHNIDTENHKWFWTWITFDRTVKKSQVFLHTCLLCVRQKKRFFIFFFICWFVEKCWKTSFQDPSFLDCCWNLEWRCYLLDCGFSLFINLTCYKKSFL